MIEITNSIKSGQQFERVRTSHVNGSAKASGLAVLTSGGALHLFAPRIDVCVEAEAGISLTGSVVTAVEIDHTGHGGALVIRTTSGDLRAEWGEV